MHLRKPCQQCFPALFRQFSRHGIGLDTGTFRQHGPDGIAQKFDPADKFRSGEDGRRRHGNIAFRLCLLTESDASAAFHQRIPDQVFLPEFIRESFGTFRRFLKQVLQGSGMTPREQPVETADFGVCPVVCLRTDGNDGGLSVEDRRDLSGDLRDPGIAFDGFGIPDTESCQFCDGSFIRDKCAGNDKRTEEIAFSAFVDPGMRCKDRFRGTVCVRRCERGFFEDLRFQQKLQKFSCPFSLNDQFAGCICRDADIFPFGFEYTILLLLCM